MKIENSICTKCGLIDDSGKTPVTGSAVCDPHDWTEWKPAPIVPEVVEFDRFGQWSHSAIHSLGEAYDEVGFGQIPTFANLQIHVIRIYEEELELIAVEDNPPDFRKWQPEAPKGDGWFPFCYSEDENDPFVVYVRPKATKAEEIGESPSVQSKIDRDFDTLAKIVEQLAFVGYHDDIGHELKNNVAFIALKQFAEQPEHLSDGYHTFDELYEYRKLYNAMLFNLMTAVAANPRNDADFNVHKSIRHSDGELCFGGGWFIVQATLPTGQISNHYKNEDWELFKCEIRNRADPFDGHTPADVMQRIKEFLTTE